MKSKFTSIASMLLILMFFGIIGWYFGKIAIPEPDFTICPLCNKSTK